MKNLSVSELIQALRAALESQKYSRSAGMRALIEASEKMAESEGPPTLTYDWLTKFAAGTIKNPSYDRVVRLQAVIEQVKAGLEKK